MFRELRIIAVLNGYMVQCGCQTLAFTSKTELVLEFQKYLDDPEGAEKRFLAKAIYPEATAAVVQSPQDYATALAGATAGQYIPAGRYEPLAVR